MDYKGKKLKKGGGLGQRKRQPHGPALEGITLQLRKKLLKSVTL